MAVCFDFCSKSFMILTVYISFYVAIHRHEVLSAPDNTFSMQKLAVGLSPHISFEGFG